MIKAVFIDIDDTLLDFGLCAKYAMHQSFNELSIDFEDYMFSVFEKINCELWTQIEKGMITENELYGRRWVKVLSEFGIHGIDGDDFENRFTENLSNSAKAIDGAEGVLKYLSSKYKIYAASNAPHLQQLRRLQKAGLLKYFTDIFTSEVIGFKKPDENFFTRCLEKSEAKPFECIFIGDSLTADISRSAALGMKTIWFNPKSSENFSGICPSHTVYSLDEIKNIL